MKEYVVIKCGKWAVYKRDNIKKVELNEDIVVVSWSCDDNCLHTDTYHPNNAKQFFMKLMKDLGVDEENRRNKEI